MRRRITGRAGARAGLLAATVALLAACSGVPPTRFHTLMAPPASAAAPTAIAATGVLAWEVQPVEVPTQVDQPQWVVRTVDGSLAVLEQERWIAPVADEVRAAVNVRLTQLLGAPAPKASAEPGSRWQVNIRVLRFDLVPGREVRLDADWTVRSDADGGATLKCHGEFAQPVSAPGYLPLAQAQQQGVARLADAIGRALKALGAGQATGCAA